MCRTNGSCSCSHHDKLKHISCRTNEWKNVLSKLTNDSIHRANKRFDFKFYISMIPFFFACYSLV